MSNKKNKGLLFIVSAPSGAGKTTLCEHVLKRLKNIVPSISFTTRARRSGEVSGQDYHFVTEQTFKAMIREKRFAEWAIVHGSYYGTDRQFIDETMAKIAHHDQIKSPRVLPQPCHYAPLQDAINRIVIHEVNFK